MPETPELLTRVARDRDRSAFAAVYDRLSPRVYGFLLKLLGNRTDADDVLQETFLQVWNQAERFDPSRASPDGWMLMIARSRAADRLRKRATAKTVGEPAVEPASSAKAGEKATDKLSDKSPEKSPDKSPEKAADKAADKAAAKPTEKAAPKPAAKAAEADAARIQALLDGKDAPRKAEAAPGGQRFIVQVGAFSDAKAAQEMRHKVEKLGLKTYAQSVETPDGTRVRVRVGTFASRDDAAKAAAKLHAAGLAGTVLTL